MTSRLNWNLPELTNRQLQEAGLLFYSYIILKRILRGLRWRVFASLFWTGIAGIIMVRIVIIVFRVRSILAISWPHSSRHFVRPTNHTRLNYYNPYMKQTFIIWKLYATRCRRL
jgi:hypothetical protein